MNYDELFEFKETENGCTLVRYLMADAAEITDIEIPSEYRSKPVTEIGASAFARANYLRSVIIPDSVCELGTEVFRNCKSLAEVKLPKNIYCIAAFIRCTILSSPIKALHDIEWEGALRPDVFSLALKYGSFNDNMREQALFRIAERGPSEDFEIAAQIGFLGNAELTDKLLERSADAQNAETAAWLLEYKRQKFGFVTEDNYEL